MTILDRANETMRSADREQLQLERLQALLARLRRNVRRYRELLGETRLTALSELGRLPFTSAADLVDAFPYGMFALPLREVIRLHSLVGPGGRHLVLGHTRNDLTNWGRLVARQLVAANVTSHDVIQICFGGGFIGQSLGYLLGAELVGASVIPEDTFHIDYQVEMLRSYRTTVLVTTPTNASDLVATLKSQHIDPQSLHLRSVLLTRPVGVEERDGLETGLFAKVRCGFGVPEIMEPGFCVECEQGRLHVNEDHFLVEVCNKELVVTTLCREAVPLLRYRTRLSCSIRDERCSCGRTGAVLVPGSRVDGCLRINEMALYESQIADVLHKTRAGKQPFRLDISERHVAIAIEMSEEFFGDQMRMLADLREEIQTEILSRLGVSAEVRYVAPGGEGDGGDVPSAASG